jgi:hypothetical protein
VLADDPVHVFAAAGHVLNKILHIKYLHISPAQWPGEKILSVYIQPGGGYPLASGWAYYSIPIPAAKVAILTSVWKILTCVNGKLRKFVQNLDNI